jgi:uncharacterized phiE125 gp8 family phage protein
MTYYNYYDSNNYGGRIPRKTGSLIAKELNKNGNRYWKVITEPTVEPITVDELKFFSRIDTTAEDTLLQGFIKAARRATESYLGRALNTQTIKMVMDFWPDYSVDLPAPPLISIDKVATVDEDDVETTYSSSNYYVVTESIPGKIVLKQSVTAPINTDRDYSGYLIQFQAGYGDSATDVPQPIREGIKVWAASVYATRTFDPKNPPPEARAFLDLFRVAGVIVR